MRQSPPGIDPAAAKGFPLLPGAVGLLPQAPADAPAGANAIPRNASTHLPPDLSS